MDDVRIPVVEDVTAEALDLRESLTQMGYAATDIAESGEQALQQVQRMQQDLVLMDVELRIEPDGIAPLRRKMAGCGSTAGHFAPSVVSVREIN